MGQRGAIIGVLVFFREPGTTRKLALRVEMHPVDGRELSARERFFRRFEKSQGRIKTVPRNIVGYSYQVTSYFRLSGDVRHPCSKVKCPMPSYAFSEFAS